MFGNDDYVRSACSGPAGTGRLFASGKWACVARTARDHALSPNNSPMRSLGRLWVHDDCENLMQAALVLALSGLLSSLMRTGLGGR
jgi:hypothetical protein